MQTKIYYETFIHHATSTSCVTTHISDGDDVTCQMQEAPR